MQVHIFEARRDHFRFGGGTRFAHHPHLDPVFAADGPADEGFLLEGGQRFGGDDPLPDLAIQQRKQFLGRGMLDLASLVDDDDFRCGGFHIRDDVRREDDDALAGQIGEQVAEAHALLGVKPDGGFIHDQQLRIIEQCLGDARRAVSSRRSTRQADVWRH